MVHCFSALQTSEHVQRFQRFVLQLDRSLRHKVRLEVVERARLRNLCASPDSGVALAAEFPLRLALYQEVVLLLTREQNLVAASLALDDPITLLKLSRPNRQVHSVNQVLARAAKRRCYPLVPESLPHSGSISDRQANVPAAPSTGAIPLYGSWARNEGSRWHSAEQRRNDRHKLVLERWLPCEQTRPH